MDIVVELLEHDADKWTPVIRGNHATNKEPEHDADKWTPVIRGNHATNKEPEHDALSTKHHNARAASFEQGALEQRASAFKAAFPDWKRPWGPSDFEDFAADARVIWLEAVGIQENRRELLGVLLARRIDQEVEILTLFRTPAASGRHVGTRLIDCLFQLVGRQKHTRIILEVAQSNTFALSLYRRFGFKVVGRRRGYYQPSSGPREDALILLRELVS